MLTGTFLPIALFVAALAATFLTYRNIRRGGARFYTLEREIILRRGLITLVAATLLYTGALAILYYQRQQLIIAALPPEEATAEAAGNGAPAITSTPLLEQFPPTPSPTSLTPQPTETATPTVCRGVVEGTGGNGLRMRDAPNGEELVVLPDGTLLTVLEDAPTEADGVIWRKVRAVGGEEGWVAEDFLTIRAPCN
jgi:hypothetical protein